MAEGAVCVVKYAEQGERLKLDLVYIGLKTIWVQIINTSGGEIERCLVDNTVVMPLPTCSAQLNAAVLSRTVTGKGSWRSGSSHAGMAIAPTAITMM